MVREALAQRVHTARGRQPARARLDAQVLDGQGLDQRNMVEVVGTHCESLRIDQENKSSGRLRP
eukprot:365679-Chlamydomonas_euryale.AAC.24